MSEMIFDALRWTQTPTRIKIERNGARPHLYLQVAAPRQVGAMCIGRPVEELARILTILSPAHHLASAEALDRIFNVEPPPLAVNMREALLKTLFIQNHLRKIYFLLSSRSGPFLPINSDHLAKSTAHCQALLDPIMKNISLTHEAVSILGGRQDHPLCAVPGGMSRPVKEKECERLAEIASACLDFSLNLAGALKDEVLLSQEALGCLADVSPGPVLSTCFIPAESAVVFLDDSGAEKARFSPEHLLGEIGFSMQPWSYEPFAYLRSASSNPDPMDTLGIGDISRSQCFFVGPLARLNTRAALSPPASEERERLVAEFGALARFDVLSGFKALPVELFQSAERLVELCTEQNLVGTEIRNLPSTLLAEGSAALESPQGLICHRYEVDEKGLVKNVEVLDAAGLNNLFRSLIAQAAAEAAIKQNETQQGIRNAVELALLPF